MSPSPQNELATPPKLADIAGRSDSLVVAITGPRGAGKGCLTTFLSMKDMAKGRQCMSNYPIRGIFRWHGKLKTVEALPLNFPMLLELNKNLKRCVACIDEINLWFAAIRHMSNANRIMAIFMQMIRKQQMSVYYTTQNYKWADPDIRWQTDLQVVCQDLYHTPQGREEDIGRGEFIRYVAIDRSGYLTGVPYEVSGAYSTGILDAKPLWNCFDTDHIINPWEAMAKVELKRPTMVVDLTGEGERDEGDKDTPFPDFSFMQEE